VAAVKGWPPPVWSILADFFKWSSGAKKRSQKRGKELRGQGIQESAYAYCESPGSQQHPEEWLRAVNAKNSFYTRTHPQS